MSKLMKSIPETSVRFSDSWQKMADAWMNGYFDVRLFAVDLVLKYELKTLESRTAWAFAALGWICWYMKP